MQHYLDYIHTDGSGLWSNKQKSVKCVGYEVSSNQHFDFGELRVYFDPTTWNVEEDGLIYTDNNFIAGIREAFGTNDIHYSEQGMQGDDYVSFDVNGQFLNMYEGV
jgi:hypothetical protein